MAIIEIAVGIAVGSVFIPVIPGLDSGITIEFTPVEQEASG
jgi:hypothetical protein